LGREIGLFIRFIPPSELPFAFPLPPSETPFTNVVQKNVVPVRYVGTVFPADVSERMQLISPVVVNQKFNWKPLGVSAFAQGARTLKRSQQGLYFSASHQGVIIVRWDCLAKNPITLR
jgi:hypothetical protein